HPVNLDGIYGCAGKRRQQDAAQGVTQGGAVTAFQGFHDKLPIPVVVTNFNRLNFRLLDFNHTESNPPSERAFRRDLTNRTPPSSYPVLALTWKFKPKTPLARFQTRRRFGG